MSRQYRGDGFRSRLTACVLVCALATMSLAGPIGCKAGGGAGGAGGGAGGAVPDSGAQPGALLSSVARYLPAGTFIVASLDLSMLGQGYGELFTQGLGMSSAEYADMIKEINDFILARVGWTVKDVKWVLVGVAEQKEVIVLVRADAEIQRGLEPIPGTDGLKGLRIEDAVVVPLAEPGLFAVLFDEGSVRWFSDRKQTLESPEGKQRLAALSGLMSRGGSAGLFAAAVSLDGDAKPIQKLKRELPPPLHGVKGASLTVGDALALNLHADNQTLQALNGFLQALVDQGEAAIKAEKADLDRKETAEGIALIAGSHLLKPLARTLMPKIDGDYAAIRLDPQGSGDAMQAVAAVWVIGVLAAVAVPSFLNYKRKSQSSEGMMNLKVIGEGALMFASMPQVDPMTGQLAQSAFPIVRGEVCTTSGGSLDQKDMPYATDFRESPWKELRFNISKPHYFRYCYASSSDGQRFHATARASDHAFEVTGLIQGGVPVLGTISEIY